MNKDTRGFDGPQELCGDLQFYSVLAGENFREPDNLLNLPATMKTDKNTPEGTIPSGVALYKNADAHKDHTPENRKASISAYRILRSTQATLRHIAGQPLMLLGSPPDMVRE